MGSDIGPDHRPAGPARLVRPRQPDVVEGVLWIVRTGAPWRDLPAAFGEWNSVFRRFSRWSAKGVWLRMFEALADDRCCRPQTTFTELSLIRAAVPMTASRWQSRTSPMPFARPARRSLLMRWSMTSRRC